jgi:SAM-dependent methyltransferase
MNKDYLTVEYNPGRRPETGYPELLAAYIANRAGMAAGQSLLEFGCGRAEVAAGFVNLGLRVTGIDAAPSAENFAKSAGIKFVQAEIAAGNELPIAPESFNFVFSKSFIEHMREPVSFLESCYTLLKADGKIVVLTPDWEANVKIFFDDVTHVSPFTRESMRQALELAGFEDIQVFRFRQLPITWNLTFMNLVAAAIAPLAPYRSKRKFLRWSKELMLCGIATKVINAKDEVPGSLRRA